MHHQAVHSSIACATSIIIAVTAGAARATHLAWNWREILAVLVASTSFAAFFCGHDHVGGYRAIGTNLHFVTLQALLEGEPRP